MTRIRAGARQFSLREGNRPGIYFMPPDVEARSASCDSSRDRYVAEFNGRALVR